MEEFTAWSSARREEDGRHREAVGREDGADVTAAAVADADDDTEDNDDYFV